MSLSIDVPRIAMQVSRGVIVATIQVDLAEEVLERFREDLLDRVHATGSQAVILDVSGLETLDSEELAALRRIITMTHLLGAESVLAGLRPGVVSSLIDTGADIDGLRAAIDLDAAFALVESETGGASEPESAAGPSEGEAPSPPDDTDRTDGPPGEWR